MQLYGTPAPTEEPREGNTKNYRWWSPGAIRQSYVKRGGGGVGGEGGEGGGGRGRGGGA